MVNILNDWISILNSKMRDMARSTQDIFLFLNGLLSIDGPCATDYFFIFKVQMIQWTIQNDFHMKI
jgi:hypothetical protein